MKKYALLVVFLAISILALTIRFYRLTEIPPSLNWDEVSLGYNAYSILKTWNDEWGQSLPLSFRAFGDYKLPLYIYLDVPFIAIFGLNELAVRLPSVLSGVGTVLLIFFIIKKLTNNIYLSFFGMFISATIPRLVIFSRISLEANLALFLTLSSFFFLLQSNKNKWLLVCSAFFLGLSAFSYNSSRVLIGPFVLLAWLFLVKGYGKKEIFFASMTLTLFIGLAFFQTFTVDSKERYKWTTILDEGAITAINQNRGSSRLPAILNRVVNNKVTYFIIKSSQNYISYFDPQFLFWKGGSNLQFSVPGTGEIYVVLFPLILLGILQVLREGQKWQFFILGWILIAPIPGAITRDAPHPLRAIFLVIPLIFCAVLGMKYIKNHIPSRVYLLITILTILTLLGSTAIFWQNYTGDYRQQYSQSWQYGYQQAVDFVNKQADKYDLVVFTKAYGEPHIFTLFFLKYDPDKYQKNENLIRYQRSNWFWVDRFDNFRFINDWEIKDKVSGMKNVLLITTAGNYPSNSRLLETIKFLNGKTAFEIVEVGNKI